MISMIKYPASFVEMNKCSLEMVKLDGFRFILAKGALAGELGFHGGKENEHGFLYPLSHENRLVLNRLLPYTAPVAFGNSIPTFGTGDRLGYGTFGHVEALSKSRAKPILAQQSKRELSLTGRTYEKVLDDVSFNVFQAGYTGGFGADGDHLKSKKDIEFALDDGYTMITLDCSDHIGKPDETYFSSLPEEYRKDVENRYLGKVFSADEKVFTFTEMDLKACISIYKAAIDYAKEVYEEFILTAGRAIDFELSIDETESVTTALHHLFVATELKHNNVKIASLAPRFIGEFQKGIDYMGDLAEFKEQIHLHARIAKSFGYKLSIHSGSDKFSAFPYIGQAAGANLHVKTSGTSWLEALRVIARSSPNLFRSIYDQAQKHFEDAREYYYVSTELSSVEPIGNLPDEKLESLLNQDGYRQILHITYGYILNDPYLGTEFFKVLGENQGLYDELLKEHIGRHISSLGLGGSV